MLPEHASPAGRSRTTKGQVTGGGGTPHGGAFKLLMWGGGGLFADSFGILQKGNNEDPGRISLFA